MNLFRDLDNASPSFRGGAVSIGNFDGVHRGHARIVRRLISLAQRFKGPAVIFTFDPHPVRLMRPEAAPIPLCTTQRKAQLLGALGIDAVIAYPTDMALLDLDARQFFHKILQQQLAARAIVEGPNFHFGRNRSGNVDVLQRLCDDAEILLDVVSPVEHGDEMVSSSRLRALISTGRMEDARAMLTAPYRIVGDVVYGAQRGTGLGYPTANVARVETLSPAEGIYAGMGWIDGVAWPAAISLGPNPTFGEGAVKIEVHLVGFEGNIYGRPLAVDFLARLRDIKRFPSVDALLAQMAEDVATTREIVKSFTAHESRCHQE